ncbi:protein bunched, class 2/F/G isoform isoform X3 [Nasonia vitripennis]|uniref:Max-binding protein MNT n=1 Tax=Nasonia vitripennis TaxID=7425 RepID=A0A7M7H4M1_NASVI|nr:protein bunched, class 2/F/G isoform isoform X3 [Nasonia vitripennis]
MSLETLLEAARYVEQLEKKKARAAAAAQAAAANAASAADHSHGVAPHSNHHNSAEPREEDPLETNNRSNGNHHHHHHHHHQQQQQQQQHALPVRGSGGGVGGGVSPSIGNSPPSANSGHLGTASAPGLTVAGHQLHHGNDHEAASLAGSPGLQQQQHNHFLNNHNSNHSQNSSSGAGSLIVDVETVQDNKKPRNAPCVIRSGTREVHNKLEKNRRAHLKECFELLKKQLPSQDEKKSSNLSILHAAIRHIQSLKRKERDYEHEMEKLAREKITAQQKMISLKKELSATWEHIDFNTILSDHNLTIETNVTKNASESMEVDAPSGGLARGGTRYSSTSSLSSAATASSPQTNGNGINSNNIHSQLATAAVVSQTQGLNLAQSSRDSPPASSSPGASTPSIPTPAQEKVTIPPVVVQQQQQISQQQQQTAQLHLPISAQMLNTSQGLATLMPTLQHLGPGLRVIPGDGRQLIVQSNGTVTGTGSGEPTPVALVVHSTAASNENRVTFVHSSSGNRPLALAVQSSGNDVRPVFVSGNETRPIVLATTHAPALTVTSAQNRIRTADAAQTTHKMVGGVALVGGNGSELARLPGGAELNILPANGMFRSVKTQPLTVQGGLTLSHAGVSLQPANKSVATTQATSGSQQQQTSTNAGHVPSSTNNQQQHEGLAAGCHIVASGHQPLAGLTPIVAPMTVVSQGNSQVILAPSSLAGKVIGTPLLKSVGQGHLPLTVNAAQYLNSLVKPVVVVSSNHQQQAQQHQQSQTANNNGTAASSQSAV